MRHAMNVLRISEKITDFSSQAAIVTKFKKPAIEVETDLLERNPCYPASSAIW